MNVHLLKGKARLLYVCVKCNFSMDIHGVTCGKYIAMDNSKNTTVTNANVNINYSRCPISDSEYKMRELLK